MLRRLLMILPLVGIAACSRETVVPERVLVGSFGGRGTELIASAESVRVQFVCSFASFRQPIIPDPDGAFSLAPVLMPTETGPAAIALKGAVEPDRIEFDAVSLSPAGDVRTSHHVVYRSQPGDYTGMACLTGDLKER